MRETQILEALSAGDTTITAIAARIYRGLDPALLPQAHESVLAHLRKLEDDGGVRLEGDAWHRR
jgi:DNA-binding transcriptional ArsR family regulator